jgi:hypothetical protein
VKQSGFRLEIVHTSNLFDVGWHWDLCGIDTEGVTFAYTVVWPGFEGP